MENVRLGNSVIIDANALIFCHREGRIEIGDGSYIGDGSIIHTGKRNGRVIIGRECTVQAYSVIYGNGGCEIGNFVRIATHNVMVSANKRFADVNVPIYKQGTDKLGIRIGDDVWFGAGGVVLDGVTIGDGAVVAAGAVVNRPAAALEIIGGVPAVAIGKRGQPQKVRAPGA
jgi:acetyltransferase-like isoleucine patch superfamily enzyme